VITAMLGDSLAVTVVEVKEPLQLTRRRHLAITPVAGNLRRTEKIDRHSASQIQRRRRSRSCAAVSAATASALGRA